MVMGLPTREEGKKENHSDTESEWAWQKKAVIPTILQNDLHGQNTVVNGTGSRTSWFWSSAEDGEIKGISHGTEWKDGAISDISGVLKDSPACPARKG